MSFSRFGSNNVLRASRHVVSVSLRQPVAQRGISSSLRRPTARVFVLPCPPLAPRFTGIQRYSMSSVTASSSPSKEPLGTKAEDKSGTPSPASVDVSDEVPLTPIEAAKEKYADEKKRLGGIKGLMKEYGKVGFATYGVVYVGTLSVMYIAASTHLVEGADATQFLSWTGLDQWLDIKEMNPKKSSFALAWILTKIVEPLRLGFTIAITPTISRLLGQRRDEKKAAEEDGQVDQVDTSSSSSSSTPSSSPSPSSIKIEEVKIEDIDLEAKKSGKKE